MTTARVPLLPGALATALALGATAAVADDSHATARDPLPDMIQKQIVACWNMPADATGSVRIEVRLKRDGSLDGKPRVVLRPAGKPSDQLAASAVRAMQRCAPFRLPAARYEEWEDLVLNFEPALLE